MTAPRPPGWYRDPQDPSRNMYWDGRTWHRNGPPPNAQVATAPTKRKKRHTILWTFGIFMLIGWLGSQCSTTDKKDTSTTGPSAATSVAPTGTSSGSTGKAPSVIKMVLSMAGPRYGITLEPTDVGRHILDDVNSERAPFDWENWRIVAQCENFVGGKLPVGVIKQDEFQRISDANMAGPDSLIATNGLGFVLDCPNDRSEPAASATTTTPTTTTATPMTDDKAPDTRPAPSNDQAERAFQAYIKERSDSGVMLAQAVTSVAVADGVATVTLDASPALLELSPFDNLAEFFGTPAAFNDKDGIWLRKTVTRVDVVNADGTLLGSMTAAELNKKAAG